ncbi:MAG: hypothetical protein FWH37_09910, partial [Candidatus Bathyarchaeota archaeon]|nr:hypothetical protein [Candidatus Termiticorpusculum sp.]
SKAEGIAKLIDCPRCSNKNSFGDIRCTTCGMILDKETALRFEETEKQKETLLHTRTSALNSRMQKID